MKPARNYFGMSPTQIGILGSLAGVACLLFGLTGWFILRGGPSTFAHAPQNTAVIPPTSTPFAIPTLTPSATPTPVPYEMLIPDGWLQFKTGLIELWLPPQFKPGDLKRFDDSINSAMRELIATGATSKSALYQMLAIVSYEPLPSASLDEYLDSQLAQLPTDIHVAARRKVSINSIDGVQFVFETKSNNVDIDDLTYVFLDGSTIWYIEYVAQINEFYEMLPTFEQSVKTFRVIR